jgi:drug/metabolite transporter (DMT)-like permease
MKRLWLYTGVLSASAVQFGLERFWINYITDSHTTLGPVLRDPPMLLSMYFSQLAFALLIGFLYLHVPDQKRSVKSGITIGTILGLLSGFLQFLNWYALFNIPSTLVTAEVAKMAALGIAGGAVISFAELKLNSGNPPAKA